MKNTNKMIAAKGLLSATMLSTSLLVLAACSGSDNGITQRQHDALKNYDTQKMGLTQIHATDVRTKSTSLPHFDIREQNVGTVVQGQPIQIKIITELNFAHNENVKYQLILTQDPTNKAATLTPGKDGAWYLNWTPAANTLSPTEQLKTFAFEVTPTLTDDSSAESKAEMNGIAAAPESIKVAVIKSFDAPIIDESSIQYFPSQNLNADKDVEATVQFVVTAKNLKKPSDLEVSLRDDQSTTDNNGNPVITNKELPQLDGKFGVTKYPHMIKPLGNDRYLYEAKFSPVDFRNALIKALEQNPTWKPKYLAGTIDQPGEAIFSIEAINRYYGQPSVPEPLKFTVNLKDEAGEPIFVSEGKTLTIQAGQTGMSEFVIDTHGGRGNLKIDSVDFKGTGVALAINCVKGSPALKKIFACETGECVQSCTAVATADCDTKPGQQTAIINATSTLPTSAASSNLKFVVDVKENAKTCGSTKVAAAAATASKGAK